MSELQGPPPDHPDARPGAQTGQPPAPYDAEPAHFGWYGHVGWSAPEPPKYPLQPEPYHYLWRAPGIAAWRPILMLVLAPIGFFLGSAVGVVGVLVISAFRGVDIMEMLRELEAGRIGPDMLVANMVALALLIPVCFLIALLSRQRPGFLSSVIGKFRWGWALICLLVALVAVIISGVAMELLAPSDVEGVPLEVQSYSWMLFAILMVVTPLQAAGEEYLLRGIGFRALGSLFPWRPVGLIAGAVITSLVFMVIHGASDPWLNFVYFTMGMLFCYLTWRTGGIEAAVAMHVANNIVGMALVPFTDFSELFDRSEGTGSALMLIQLVMLIFAAAIIELLARYRKLAWAGSHQREPVPVADSRVLA